MKAWPVILILCLILVFSASLGYLLIKHGTVKSLPVSNIRTSGGAFPDSIESFERINTDSNNVEKKCNDIDGDKVCSNTTKYKYISNDKAVRVFIIEVTQGYDKFSDYIEEKRGPEVLKNVYLTDEIDEIYWKSEKFDYISIDFDDHVKIQGNGYSSEPAKKIWLENPVTVFYLRQYPPIF